MHLLRHLLLLSTVALVWSTAKHEQYIHSPSSRNVKPQSVYGIEGNVTNPLGVLSNESATMLAGVNSTLVLDFGYITAGLLSFNYTAHSPGQKLGIAFSESLYYATRSSDSSIELNGEKDGAINLDLTDTHWTAPARYLRGGFRYVTLFMRTAGAVELSGLENYFTAAPNLQEDALRDYSGYFYSDDDLLNRVWYAAAYTNQLSTISAGSSRNTTANQHWNNSEIIQPLEPSDYLLVDGAKRDRTEWPGDFATAISPIFIANNNDNMRGLKNALRALYAEVDEGGMLPYAGSPLSLGPQSYTYHLWTLVATYEYWVYSGDEEFIGTVWSVFRRGIDVSLQNLDESGLLNVPQAASSSWGRSPTWGHDLTANAVLYNALQCASKLAHSFNQPEVAKEWEGRMQPLSTAINTHLWDEGVGMYKDNDTDAGYALHPQDGNAVAVLYGVADGDRSRVVSASLKRRWNDYGAVSPEGLDAISPFVSGLEVSAHAKACNISNALELIRLEWGYMLNAFSNSTLVEGFYHDGTLHYPFYGSLDSYISHAHAWSTTPLATLTQDVVGLKIVDVLGSQWEYAPKNTYLRHTESGFRVKEGEFSARMRKSDVLVIYELRVPGDTRGVIKLPVMEDATVSIDGEKVEGKLVGECIVFEDVQGDGNVMEIVVARNANFAANWDTQTDPTRPETDAFA